MSPVLCFLMGQTVQPCCSCEDDFAADCTMPVVLDNPVQALPAVTGRGDGHGEPEPQPEVFPLIQQPREVVTPMPFAQDTACFDSGVESFKQKAVAASGWSALMRQIGSAEVEVISAMMDLDLKQELPHMRMKIGDIEVDWPLADVKAVYAWKNSHAGLFSQQALEALTSEQRNYLIRLDITHALNGRVQTLFLLEKNARDRDIVFRGLFFFVSEDSGMSCRTDSLVDSLHGPLLPKTA